MVSRHGSRVRLEVDFDGKARGERVEALEVVLEHQARILLFGEEQGAEAEVDSVFTALDVGREHAAGAGQFCAQGNPQSSRAVPYGQSGSRAVRQSRAHRGQVPVRDCAPLRTARLPDGTAFVSLFRRPL